jgi:hypothetical protein
MERLCKYFGDIDPRDLDLATHILEEDIVKALSLYDRRTLIAMLQGLPAFAGVDLLALLETPSSSPGEILAQCSAAINACWQLLKHGDFETVQRILSTHVPRLTPLTAVPDYRDIAAGLTMQAKLLEGKLAWHRLDFTGHEITLVEAVHFGKLTGDRYMHATALLYSAYAYAILPPYRLGKATKCFAEALQLIDGETSLLHADIHVSQAVVYARNGNSTYPECFGQGGDHAGDQPTANPQFPLR